MNNISVEIDYITYSLELTGLNEKNYKNFIVKTIETTDIILNELNKLKDKNNNSSMFRTDRQIKRGINYLKKFLDTNKVNYAIKTIKFLNYLLYEELVTEPKYKELKEIVELLESNSLKLNEIISEKLKKLILSFDCLLDLAKYLDEIEIEGFSGLINLLNIPNKNDILIASIYHLTAIQIEWEIIKSDSGIGFDIDFNNEKYKPYFKKSKEIINYLFKQTDRKDIKNNINIMNYSKRYAYFIYKDKILGIIPSFPRHRTGYSSISNYWGFNYSDNEGLRGYFFSEPHVFKF